MTIRGTMLCLHDSLLHFIYYYRPQQVISLCEYWLTYTHTSIWDWKHVYFGEENGWKTRCWYLSPLSLTLLLLKTAVSSLHVVLRASTGDYNISKNSYQYNLWEKIDSVYAIFIDKRDFFVLIFLTLNKFLIKIYMIFIIYLYYFGAFLFFNIPLF